MKTIFELREKPEWLKRALGHEYSPNKMEIIDEGLAQTRTHNNASIDQLKGVAANSRYRWARFVVSKTGKLHVGDAEYFHHHTIAPPEEHDIIGAMKSNKDGSYEAHDIKNSAGEYIKNHPFIDRLKKRGIGLYRDMNKRIDEEATHFIGFKDDRYHNAKKVFGHPDFVHRRWDKRAKDEVVDGDTVIFADGSAREAENGPSHDDSEDFAKDKKGRIPNNKDYMKENQEHPINYRMLSNYSLGQRIRWGDRLAELEKERRDRENDIHDQPSLIQTKPVPKHERRQFKAWFGDSKVTDKNGNPKIVYHGTLMGDLSKFDDTKSTIKNFIGNGHYFTSHSQDAGTYTDAFRGDVKGKIDIKIDEYMDLMPNELEELAYEKGFIKEKNQWYRRTSDDQLNLTFKSGHHNLKREPVHVSVMYREMAMSDLFKTHGNIYPVYLSIKKPYYIKPSGKHPHNEDDNKATVFGVDYELNAESDPVQDNGEGQRFIETLKDIARAHDLENIAEQEINNIAQHLQEKLYEDEELDFNTIYRITSIYNNDDLVDENGNSLWPEVIRKTIEAMGYDGIIDYGPRTRWPGLFELLPRDEYPIHYVVFSGAQVKSVFNNRFNPNHPEINEDATINFEPTSPFHNYVGHVEPGVPIIFRTLSNRSLGQLIRNGNKLAEIEKRRRDMLINARYNKVPNPDAVVPVQTPVDSWGKKKAIDLELLWASRREHMDKLAKSLVNRPSLSPEDEWGNLPDDIEGPVELPETFNPLQEDVYSDEDESDIGNADDNNPGKLHWLWFIPGKEKERDAELAKKTKLKKLHENLFTNAPKIKPIVQPTKKKKAVAPKPNAEIINYRILSNYSLGQRARWGDRLAMAEIERRNSTKEFEPANHIEPEHPNAYSPEKHGIDQRYPKAVLKNQLGNVYDKKRLIDKQSMLLTPGLYDKNVNLVRNYPNMQKSTVGMTTTELGDHFISHTKDNLVWLYNQVPEHIRSRSRRWYDGAHGLAKEWSNKYNVPLASVAGALAGLSPNLDWNMNVSLAERTLQILKGNNGKQITHRWDEKMDKVWAENERMQKYTEAFDVVRGKTLDEIDALEMNADAKSFAKGVWIKIYDSAYGNPNYKIFSPDKGFGDFVRKGDGTPSNVSFGMPDMTAKAVRCVESNGDMNVISEVMGEKHKIRNFFNNIYNPDAPDGDITIDTHAVAAGLLRPLSGTALEVVHNLHTSTPGQPGTSASASTGVTGTYGLFADAYRQAAKEVGVKPRELQSVVWEAIRGMYSPSFKRSKDNKQRVDDVWQQYKNGDITIDTVRKELLKITGGISDPDWHTTEEEGVEKPDTGIHESRGATSHPANLSRFGLRRKTPFEAKLRARIGHS